MFRLSKKYTKKIKKSCLTVPLQFLPFPVNPVLHEHLKLPKVFLQFEFEPQLFIPLVHSLMSASQIV